MHETLYSLMMMIVQLGFVLRISDMDEQGKNDGRSSQVANIYETETDERLMGIEKFPCERNLI